MEKLIEIFKDYGKVDIIFNSASMYQKYINEHLPHRNNSSGFQHKQNPVKLYFYHGGYSCAINDAYKKVNYNNSINNQRGE